MVTDTQVLSVTKRIAFEEVNWAKVMDLLIRRGKLSFREVNTMRRNFFKRFLTPFNLYWFRNRDLNESDNKVVAAVCDVHSTDHICLYIEKLVKFGPLRFDYIQQIRFEPGPDEAKDQTTSGYGSPRIELKFMGRSLVLTSAKGAYAFNFILSVVTLALLIVALALLVYSLAVFFEFLKTPVPITKAATQDGRVGLALICFLVGISAICGRAVSNLGRLALDSIKKWSRKKIPNEAKPQSPRTIEKMAKLAS